MGEEKRSVDRESRYGEGTVEERNGGGGPGGGGKFRKKNRGKGQAGEADKDKRVKVKIENNRKYKEMLTEELPRYLLGKKKKKRMLIVRYRCGSEVKSSQHWREEEDRRCRLCQREEENLDHILKECEATKSEIQLEEFLREVGKDSEVMRWIEKVRREDRSGEGN